MAILAGMIAVWLSVQPALACNCPKEQMLKQYGTVSLLGGAAKPRPGPLRPVAVTTGQVGAPDLLPLLLYPIAEKPRSDMGLTPGWLFLAPLPPVD